MSKIAVVYWSGTGNTEAMANLVAEGATDAGAEGEWMDNWKADADEEGVNVVDSVICYDAPDDESEAACRALGAELA